MCGAQDQQHTLHAERNRLGTGLRKYHNTKLRRYLSLWVLVLFSLYHSYPCFSQSSVISLLSLQPHFVYLAQVWNKLNHYFNHVVEINKIREALQLRVPPDMEMDAIDIIMDVKEMASRRTDLHVQTFDERMNALNKFETDGNFSSLAEADIKEFCGLSLAVTNGLLLPAKVIRKLCMNVDIKFGFQDQTYARIGEVWFERFITALRQAIFNSANLCLLFKLDDVLIEREMKPIEEEPPKTQCSETQTDMVVTNDLSPKNWINVTWNAWDYHRETIHLAEIRKRQTHDAQTKVTFGQRNAQNQTYNTRQHM